MKANNKNHIPRPVSLQKERDYCRALMRVLLRYTDASETAELTELLETFSAGISASRPCQGLVDAQYHQYRRFWL